MAPADKEKRKKRKMTKEGDQAHTTKVENERGQGIAGVLQFLDVDGGERTKIKISFVSCLL